MSPYSDDVPVKKRRAVLNPKYNQPALTTCRSMEDLGRVIRTRRKELGYTQSQIAGAAGISQRLMSELERGRGTVAFDTVVDVAMWLGIDIIASIRGK